MIKLITLITFAIALTFTMNATAMDKTDHSTMNHGTSEKDGIFSHAAMVDGIHSEFQIMSLASMKMKDPDGKTHHVMATFMKDDSKIEKAAGKVKLIAPSGEEQTGTLKNFGGGTYATNFNIDEAGKWGVICLFKDSDGQHTVKFWYEHHMM
jgi:hypothetical protein